MEIQGCSAVITGGGNGIGRAIALALAKEGVHVAVADIEEGAAQAVAAEVEALGVRSLAIRADVTQETDVVRTADAAWEAFGSVELLFNNAGVIPDRGKLFEFSAEDVRWVLSVNVEAMLHGVRVFAPRFIESGKPCRIVNTGSEHSMGVPHTGAGIYTASKHAVLGLSDVLRRELPDRVGVSVLCPGMVTSSLWRSAERRPDDLGGSGTVDPGQGAAMENYGMPADEAAQQVVKGLKEDRFFILTHAHVVDIWRQRWDEAETEYAEQVPRYDGDDKYDVNQVIARVMAQARSDAE